MLNNQLKRLISEKISIVVLIGFISTTVMPPAYAQQYILPLPGIMVPLSPQFNPPMLTGVKVHPDNPFRFDFIMDKGDSDLNKTQLKDELTRLIKYFLASITVPEKDLWVNLSPYEKNRIVPDVFGKTEMGRDLLAEDYILKQITASLMYPEYGLGKKFWDKVYDEAQKKFGITDIPVDTFNKVWIVPEKAVVYENAKAGTAYVVKAKLKVMLDVDYLAMNNRDTFNDLRSAEKQPRTAYNVPHNTNIASDVIRQIIIPAIEKEVNEGANFAKLRQVYNSLIIATWYKKKIKDSILSQVYSDKNKIAGVKNDDPKEKEKIYQRYLEAFKKGVYNYIKEDYDPQKQEIVPRKYFSGGLEFTNFAMNTALKFTGDPSSLPSNSDNAQIVEIKLDPAMRTKILTESTGKKDNAQVSTEITGEKLKRMLILIGKPLVVRFHPKASEKEQTIEGQFEGYAYEGKKDKYVLLLKDDRGEIFPRTFRTIDNLSGDQILGISLIQTSENQSEGKKGTLSDLMQRIIEMDWEALSGYIDAEKEGNATFWHLKSRVPMIWNEVLTRGSTKAQEEAFESLVQIPSVRAQVESGDWEMVTLFSDIYIASEGSKSEENEMLKSLKLLAEAILQHGFGRSGFIPEFLYKTIFSVVNSGKRSNKRGQKADAIIAGVNMLRILVEYGLANDEEYLEKVFAGARYLVKIDPNERGQAVANLDGHKEGAEQFFDSLKGDKLQMFWNDGPEDVIQSVHRESLAKIIAALRHLQAARLKPDPVAIDLREFIKNMLIFSLGGENQFIGRFQPVLEHRLWFLGMGEANSSFPPELNIGWKKLYEIGAGYKYEYSDEIINNLISEALAIQDKPGHGDIVDKEDFIFYLNLFAPDQAPFSFYKSDRKNLDQFLHTLNTKEGLAIDLVLTLVHNILRRVSDEEVRVLYGHEEWHLAISAIHILDELVKGGMVTEETEDRINMLFDVLFGKPPMGSVFYETKAEKEKHYEYSQFLKYNIPREERFETIERILMYLAVTASNGDPKKMPHVNTKELVEAFCQAGYHELLWERHYIQDASRREVAKMIRFIFPDEKDKAMVSEAALKTATGAQEIIEPEPEEQIKNGKLYYMVKTNKGIFRLTVTRRQEGEVNIETIENNAGGKWSIRSDTKKLRVISAPKGEPKPEPYLLSDTYLDTGWTNKEVPENAAKFVRQVIANNNYTSKIVASLRQLVKTIQEGGIIEPLPLDSKGGDVSYWNDYVMKDVFKKGLRWNGDVPHNLGYAYFFRLLLDKIDYWGTQHKKDPFAPMKQKALKDFLHPPQISPEEPTKKSLSDFIEEFEQAEDKLSFLLDFDLWMNNYDPSNPIDLNAEKHYLVDGRKEGITKLKSGTVKTVEVDTDNAGPEIVGDLWLMQYLLDNGFVDKVIMNVKNYPFLISDAIKDDVNYTIEQLKASPDDKVAQLGQRLEDLIKKGKLVIEAHPFSTSGLTYDKKPEELKRRPDLIFVNGDWNYRLVTGNLRWGIDADINRIILSDVPVVIKRTVKNETVIGANKDLVSAFVKKILTWFRKGWGGMLQYVVPADKTPLGRQKVDKEEENPSTQAVPPDDQAMSSTPYGGIDLTADKTPLEMRNSDKRIRFHLDPAMLAQLQNAPGFVPVIINIQPLTNLQMFLGLSQ